MCGRSPDNHHAIAIAAPLPPPPSVVVVEMAPHDHRPGKEEAEYNEEEDDDREFEEEFLRFSMMEDEEDDDDDGEEIIAVVSPPRRPLVGARGTTSAVESVTNLPVATETGGDGTKASKRRRGSAKPPAAKKARSKHGFHGVHRRTYGRWAAEIRDTVIKGTRVWIGTFDTAEAAALAYDAAARRIFGGNARTNFPDDGGDRPPLPLPPPPSPPAAKPCSSSKSKRPTKKRNTGNGTTTARRRRRGDQEDAAAATAPPQAVVATGNSDDTPAPGASVELISLCTAAAQALELTDGWEFEPFIQELLLGGGVAPLDYFNGQELVGAASGDLWSF